ncbi:ketose-bisphosphate aldolase [Caldicoprobacter guelmensis]|uniref:class II fructose-bisphosphate aldolase n=1 Tax=Caldicoprobacter guelmensis TaxID=1170224 RepID=UPI001957983F|nr:class II fructose-bisphosphate aldolase [Caldicoprobacter guelmensis]MBM7583234.1 ketose-bisphosphate aldolase [Caldicoprobacter guelmensis]
MGYVNLKEMLLDAKKNGYAVGAFNIVDYATMAAVIKAAENKKSPVIIQTSAKTVSLYGYKSIVAWVKALAVDSAVPVALHLDHCKDLDMIKNCIEAGWSSVMIDASSLPLEENIELTKKVVAMAKPKNVTVEGELGVIAGVEDDIFVKDSQSYLADPDTCEKYVNATGVDVLAPAIGTAHGLYRRQPNVNFNLLSEIARRVDVPLAIHGGTGLSEEILKKCIANGGSKINVSTELKYIFRNSIEEYYKANPDDYEPVKMIKYLEQNITKRIEDFIDIFGSTNRVL